MHLVVHQDPRSGAHGLTLAAPIFEESWQNDVALGAASTAHALLAAGHTREQAAEVGRKMMEGASKIADGLLARPDAPPVACHSGCAHCCFQAVGVSAPEVFAIHAHLRATRTPAELEALQARMRAADERTHGMTSAERLSPELPCPFLEDARCSIYEVRPLSCRGTNSLDADACAELLRDPTARAAFVAGARTFPCFLEPIRGFHAVTAGLQLALDELHGLETQPLELTAAMRVMFEHAEDAPEAWLAGGDPFRTARGGDSTDNPRIAALSGRRRP